MTERDSTCGIDSTIRCDICNKSSGWTDPREPWDRRDEKRNPKPTWRCDICIEAVTNATEQRHGMYSTVKFDSKEQQAAWDKKIKEDGWHEISLGPSISTEEIKRRRFK